MYPTKCNILQQCHPCLKSSEIVPFSFSATEGLPG